MVGIVIAGGCIEGSCLEAAHYRQQLNYGVKLVRFSDHTQSRWQVRITVAAPVHTQAIHYHKLRARNHCHGVNRPYRNYGNIDVRMSDPEL